MAVCPSLRPPAAVSSGASLPNVGSGAPLSHPPPCAETLRLPSMLLTTLWRPTATWPFLEMVQGHLEEGGEALEEEEVGPHKDRALGPRCLSDSGHEAVS